jgi:hypothetical protein
MVFSVQYSGITTNVSISLESIDVTQDVDT